jgi:hypothetical protein
MVHLNMHLNMHLYTHPYTYTHTDTWSMWAHDHVPLCACTDVVFMRTLESDCLPECAYLCACACACIVHLISQVGAMCAIAVCVFDVNVCVHLLVNICMYIP